MIDNTSQVYQGWEIGTGLTVTKYDENTIKYKSISPIQCCVFIFYMFKKRVSSVCHIYFSFVNLSDSDKR